MHSASIYAALLGAVCVSACGGSSSAPPSPESSYDASQDSQSPASPSAGKKSGMAMQGELGEVSQADAERAFVSAEPALSACHKKGIKQHEYLAGDFSFLVRIGEDGRARYVVLERSDLGDRSTELCMLDALKTTRWPVPEGGEAEARKSLGFSEGDARPPFNWSSDKANDAIEAARPALSSCGVGQGSARFSVTAYVEPSGKSGKVAAIGGAASSPEAFAQIDCVLNALKNQSFPSPGSYAAKVSFEL